MVSEVYKALDLDLIPKIQIKVYLVKRWVRHKEAWVPLRNIIILISTNKNCSILKNKETKMM